MASRSIIWCQTSDASAFAKVQGKKYTHVIISALHMHCDGGNYVMYLNDTPVGQINLRFGELSLRCVQRESQSLDCWQAPAMAHGTASRSIPRKQWRL